MRALAKGALAKGPWAKALPRLLFFTDPVRTPEPEAIAATLPRGAAIVFRPFGAPDAEARARRLKAIARQRGLLLLIGADAQLAGRVAADGVHLPSAKPTGPAPFAPATPAGSSPPPPTTNAPSTPP